MKIESKATRQKRGGLWSAALRAHCLLLPLLLGACSALPDWADPAGWFSRDAARLQVAPAQPSTQQAKSAPAPAASSQAVKAGIPAKQIPLDAAAGTLAQPRIAKVTGATVPKLTVQVAERPDAGATGGPAQPAAGRTELVGIIYFGHGSAALRGHDRQVLRDVIALHRQRGGSIRVVGHASARTTVVDAVQHSMANFEMSWKRANTVAAELVQLGAVQDEVHAEARSDAQPIYHEFMPTGEAGNRRAEIFLEY
jgi:outer membrane protein OmpA-like peptidoglycan-associated protein